MDDRRRLGMPAEQQEDQRVRAEGRWGTAVTGGIAGGLFFSTLHYLAYLLRFTSVSPALWIEWGMGKPFGRTAAGLLLSIAVWTVLSVAVAVLYDRVAGERLNPNGGGVTLGVVLWVLLFIGGPMLGFVPDVRQLDIDTLSTELALFLVYGLFVGHSLSDRFRAERTAS